MNHPSEIKQRFINVGVRILGAVSHFQDIPDDTFHKYLIGMEKLVQETRHNLTIRHILDTQDLDDDEL